MLGSQTPNNQPSSKVCISTSSFMIHNPYAMLVRKKPWKLLSACILEENIDPRFIWVACTLRKC